MTLLREYVRLNTRESRIRSAAGRLNGETRSMSAECRLGKA